MSEVLFLHGFLGLAKDFDPCFKNLKINSRLSIPYTERPELSPEVFISDWGQNFINAYSRLGPLTAVGYSQGGRMLLGAFAMAPQLFKSLVLISSHSGLKSNTEKEARLSSDRQWAQRFRTQKWDSLMSEWSSQSVFQGGNPVLRSEQNFNREALALCLENWSLAHQPDYSQMIHENENIFVIVGERDQKYRDLYSHLGSRLLITKGAAHRVPSDQPIHLAETLNSIL